MKTLLIALTLVGSAFGADYVEPSAHADKYLLVAVSGFKTGRDKSESEDIFSNIVGKGSEASGVWTYMNINHEKIFKTVYLSHYSKDSELKSVMNLAVDEKGECKKKQGLIMMVNSWGAKMSQKLADMYLQKCGQLPNLTILIDGVSKPTPFAYDKPIRALNCVNFYQQSSTLKGTSIENCYNVLSNYNTGSDLFNAHIHLEWDASKRGNSIIEQFLDGKLPVMFVRDIYQIDYRKGL